jgi:hypothetical protein
MTISRFTPPLDYLQAASRSSLQSFELARLNHAANLRQEISVLIDQWIQESSEALFARWMLDHHKSLQSAPLSPAEVVRSLIDPLATLFPDSPSPISDIVPAPPRFSASAPPHERSAHPQTPKTKAIRNWLTAALPVPPPHRRARDTQFATHCSHALLATHCSPCNSNPAELLLYKKPIEKNKT